MFVYYIDIGVVDQMIDISIVELRPLLIIGIFESWDTSGTPQV